MVSAGRVVDLSLYLVVVPEMCLGRPVEGVVERAVEGGVSVVQLRMKDCSTRELLRQAERLREMLGSLDVPLIVNDRVDVALAARAQGVHVGQDDMPVAAARRLMGQGALIGLSTGTMDQALAAETAGADYLGVGPIYPTDTKSITRPCWGPERLRELRERSGQLLVAIGGLNASNAAEVVAAGADGIAVASAICSAEDPLEAARELRAAVECGRGQRGLETSC